MSDDYVKCGVYVIEELTSEEDEDHVTWNGVSLL